MSRFRLILLPLAALVLGALAIAACGDDDNATTTPSTAASATAAVSATAKPSATATTAGAPTEAEALQFMKDLTTTFNGGDLDGFIATFSDDALVAFVHDDPGTSRAQAETDAKSNVSGGKFTIHDVTKQDSSGNNITVLVNSDDGTKLVSETFTLAREAGGIQIANYEHGEPEFPSDAKQVLVEGTEYQFITDTKEITGTDVAFQFSNIGSQFHEMYLLKIDATTPAQTIVDDALAATDPSRLPASILTDIGPVVAPPGVMSNFIPVKPFESGRYLMLCFIPDQTDNQPHAAKGMFKEFTIP